MGFKRGVRGFLVLSYEIKKKKKKKKNVLIKEPLLVSVDRPILNKQFKSILLVVISITFALRLLDFTVKMP